LGIVQLDKESVLSASGSVLTFPVIQFKWMKLAIRNDLMLRLWIGQYVNRKIVLVVLLN
jgi:hypothetical protein